MTEYRIERTANMLVYIPIKPTDPKPPTDTQYEVTKPNAFLKSLRK